LTVTACGLSVVNDNPHALADADHLKAGTRVRVHTESHGRVVGHLARVSADSIVLEQLDEGGLQLALPVAAVSRIDISAGRRSRTGRGALIGLLAGGAAGSVALSEICEDSCVGAWILLAFPIGGALVGAAVGAGVGSEIKTERWQRVSWR
jgi:hypothetical protein